MFAHQKTNLHNHCLNIQQNRYSQYNLVYGKGGGGFVLIHICSKIKFYRILYFVDINTNSYFNIVSLVFNNYT